MTTSKKLTERLEQTMAEETHDLRWFGEKCLGLAKAQAGTNYQMNHLAADYEAAMKKIEAQTTLIEELEETVVGVEKIARENATLIAKIKGYLTEQRNGGTK